MRVKQHLGNMALDEWGGDKQNFAPKTKPCFQPREKIIIDWNVQILFEVCLTCVDNARSLKKFSM